MFKDVHKNFFNKLQAKHPTLSKKETELNTTNLARRLPLQVLAFAKKKIVRLLSTLQNYLMPF